MLLRRYCLYWCSEFSMFMAEVPVRTRKPPLYQEKPPVLSTKQPLLTSFPPKEPTKNRTIPPGFQKNYPHPTEQWPWILWPFPVRSRDFLTPSAPHVCNQGIQSTISIVMPSTRAGTSATKNKSASGLPIVAAVATITGSMGNPNVSSSAPNISTATIATHFSTAWARPAFFMCKCPHENCRKHELKLTS